MSAPLFVVERVGVYRQGTVFVEATEEEARAKIEAFLALTPGTGDADGYHEFELWRFAAGEEPEALAILSRIVATARGHTTTEPAFYWRQYGAPYRRATPEPARAKRPRSREVGR